MHIGSHLQDNPSALTGQNSQNGSQSPRQGTTVIQQNDSGTPRASGVSSLSFPDDSLQARSASTGQLDNLPSLEIANHTPPFTPLLNAVYDNNIALVKTLLEASCNWEPDCDLPEATPLHIAAHFGYTEIMELLIQRDGANLNRKDNQGNTPLHLAVKNNQLEAIEILLRYNEIDVNATDCFGRTPLFYAAQNKNIDAIYLLGFHLDADLVHQDIWVGNVLVNIANTKKSKTDGTTLAIVNTLLAAGIDVDSTDQDGHSALFYAVKHQNVALIECLLENGASYTLKNKEGITPYTFAEKHNLQQSLHALKAFISSNPTDDESPAPKIDTHVKSAEPAPLPQTAPVAVIAQAPLNQIEQELLDAVKKADMQTLNKLTKGGSQGINTQDPTGNTLLHIAIKSNAQGSHDKVIAWLLKMKPQFNDQNHAGDTPLMVAIERGDVKTIDALSKKYVDWKKTNRSGDTALHKAVKSGNESIVKSVLKKEKSIDINAQNAEGATAIHVAVGIRNESIVKLLLEHKDIDLRVKDNALNNTALHLALSNGGIDIAKLLLAHSKNLQPNERNQSGNTILHMAVMAENRDMLESILEYDLDLSISNQDGQTAIQLAESKHLQDIVDRLRQYAKDQQIKKNGNPVENPVSNTRSKEANKNTENPLSRMKSMIGNANPASLESLKKLLNLNQVDTEAKNEALLFAVEKGNLDAISLLVKSGANVNCQTKDKNQDTALHLAARNGQNEVWDCLIQHKANTQIKNTHGFKAEDIKLATDTKYGRSALYQAIIDRDIKRIERLLALSANPHDKNPAGLTVLHELVTSQDIKAIKPLKNLGKNALSILKSAIDAKDKNGRTPLHFAAMTGNTEAIHTLIDLGANLDIQDNDGLTPFYFTAMSGTTESIHALIKLGADFHAQDKNGRTPLHFAAMNGNTEAIRALKELGADLDVQDKNGRIPLYYAQKNGNTESIHALIKLGADFHIQGSDGETPLHLAAAHGNGEVIKVLIELGARLHSYDNYARTPLHYAVTCGNTEAIKVLMELGADPYSQDESDTTPLDLAWKGQNPEVIKILKVARKEEKITIPGSNTTLSSYRIVMRES